MTPDEKVLREWAEYGVMTDRHRAALVWLLDEFAGLKAEMERRAMARHYLPLGERAEVRRK